MKLIDYNIIFENNHIANQEINDLNMKDNNSLSNDNLFDWGLCPIPNPPILLSSTLESLSLALFIS